MGAKGASAVLDAAALQQPEIWNRGLIEGAVRALPLEALHKWDKRISKGMIAHPHAIRLMQCFAEAPKEGEVQCEMRFAGFQGDGVDSPCVMIELSESGKVWMLMEVVLKLLPAMGSLGLAAPSQQRRFVEGKKFIPGLGLATFEGDATSIDLAQLSASEWMPGTYAEIYRADGEGKAMAREIAIKDHLAQQLKVHPSRIEALSDKLARLADAPEKLIEIETVYGDGRLTVRTVPPPL
jgi:hypothetical protein